METHNQASIRLLKAEFLKKNIQSIVLTFVVTVASVHAFAATPEERGLEIAQEMEKRDQGWESATADMRMILRDKSGNSVVREMRTSIIEIPEDSDKSIIFFNNPPDVKGTALLTFSHKVGDDDQWIFLPALKRVRRIASRNKSGPFMGSEFSYEDLSSPEIEKYSYKYIRDEMLDDKDSFVVERYPVSKTSGYSRQVVWIDKAEYRPYKVDFYDRKDFKLKTLLARDFEKYLNRYWRPGKSLMVNHQSGKSTLLSYSNYKFKAGLRESDFNKGKLKDMR